MKITTFLTFVSDQCGKAQEAIDFYTSIFPNSKIKITTANKIDEIIGATVHLLGL